MAALCVVPDGNVLLDAGVDEGAEEVADSVGEEMEGSFGRQAVWEGGLARVCARFPDGE